MTLGWLASVFDEDCTGAAAHTLPEGSQISDGDAVVTAFCLGCTSGAGIEDGDGAATVIELDTLRVAGDGADGRVEAGAHTLPEALQINDPGAVAIACCLDGCTSGAAIGDGAAIGAEPATLRDSAEGVEVAAGAAPIARLPTAIHIWPEKSQINELMTVEPFAGGVAARAGDALGNADDCAIAIDAHSKAGAAVVTVQSLLDLYITYPLLPQTLF